MQNSFSSITRTCALQSETDVSKNELPLPTITYLLLAWKQESPPQQSLPMQVLQMGQSLLRRSHESMQLM